MESTTQPQIDQSQIKVKTLTPELLKSLDVAYRPTLDEFNGMVQAILRTKTWTRPFLSVLVGIGGHELTLMERGLKQPTIALMRTVWFLYMMDVAPEKAFSVVHIASWGKIEAHLPRPQHKLQGEERAAAIKLLSECAASKYTIPPYRTTLKQMGERFTMSRMAVTRLAKDAGYHVANGRSAARRKKMIPAYLRPESIWMHTDWRLSNTEVAEKNGTTMQNVSRVRSLLRRVGKKVLRRHIRACGSNIDFFPFFGPFGRDGME